MRSNLFEISFDKDNDFLADFGSSENNFSADLLPVIQTAGGEIYYDTEENWNSKPALISKKGAIYVYSNHSYKDEDIPIPAIKVGDGLAYLIDMPFVNEDVSGLLSSHVTDHIVHITDEERTFWNNKVVAFISHTDEETLILSSVSNGLV